MFIKPDNSEQKFGTFTTGAIAWGVHDTVSFVIGASFCSLFCFHTFLIVMKKGTYDYIVEGQAAREAKRKERQAKLKQASIGKSGKKSPDLSDPTKESLGVKPSIVRVDSCTNLCKSSFDV